ncbi:hypothetical protein KY347_05185 [Candidatus Woesearchaeota archaeon]|nr:hypothetical protein [Candidatus Woesearchaeota archaeon]
MIRDKEYVLIGASAWVSSLASFYIARTLPQDANIFEALFPSGIIVLVVMLAVGILLKMFKIA